MAKQTVTAPETTQTVANAATATATAANAATDAAPAPSIWALIDDEHINALLDEARIIGAVAEHRRVTAALILGFKGLLATPAGADPARAVQHTDPKIRAAARRFARWANLKEGELPPGGELVLEFFRVAYAETRKGAAEGPLPPATSAMSALNRAASAVRLDTGAEAKGRGRKPRLTQPSRTVAAALAEATEKATEKATETATEKATEKTTETATEKATETATEKATETAPDDLGEIIRRGIAAADELAAAAEADADELAELARLLAAASERLLAAAASAAAAAAA